jgi:hypothetical protein
MAAICGNCGTSGDGQDSLCGVCSAPLFDDVAGYEPQPGAEGPRDDAPVWQLGNWPASSSSGRLGASPAERSAYLASLPGADGEPAYRMSLVPPRPRDGTMGLIHDLGRADEAVEAAERAMTDADTQLAYVREVVCAGALDEQDLDPDQAAQLRDAQNASYRAGQRYRRARGRQNLLASDFARLAEPPGRYPQPWDDPA